MQSVYFFSLKMYMVHWHSEYIAIGLLTTTLQLTTVQLG